MKKNIKNSSHCEELTARKQSYEIATPYGLAMTVESGRSIPNLSFSDLIRESTGRDFNAPRYTQYAQCGRSMVEMLGVLAVMGVLSVGGVAMYSTAMSKHRANELMYEASKRAAIVQAQLAQGRSADQISLAEFPNNNTGYGTFQTDVIAGTDGTTFGINVSGVPEGVCEQLAALSSDKIQVKKQGALNSTFTAANCDSSDSNALAFVFGDGELTNSGNTDNPDTNDPDTPAGACDSFPGTSLTGAGGFVPGYPCACEDEGDGWNGTACQTGYEDPDDGSGSGSCSGSGSGCEVNLGACATNAHCADYEGCENGVCFCNYKRRFACECDNNCPTPSEKIGVCQVRQFGRLPSGATSEGYFRSKGYMDWYSAQNFCASYNNGQMVHLSDIGVGTNAGQYLTVPEGQNSCYADSSSDYPKCGLTSNTVWNDIKAKFGDNWYPWTANLSPSGTTNTNSCGAFYVYLNIFNAYVINNNRSRDGGSVALCK